MHTIDEAGNNREIRFSVSVSGPTSLLLGPIMKLILGKALPPTVDRLVLLAEGSKTA